MGQIAWTHAEPSLKMRAPREISWPHHGQGLSGSPRAMAKGGALLMWLMLSMKWAGSAVSCLTSWSQAS